MWINSNSVILSYAFSVMHVVCECRCERESVIEIVLVYLASLAVIKWLRLVPPWAEGKSFDPDHVGSSGVELDFSRRLRRDPQAALTET